MSGKKQPMSKEALKKLQSGSLETKDTERLAHYCTHVCFADHPELLLIRIKLFPLVPRVKLQVPRKLK